MTSSISLARFVTRANSTKALCLVVFSLLVAFHWWPMLSFSFFIDEAVTGWITNGDVDRLLARSIDFQYTTPLYYLLVYPFVQIGPGQEFFLRLPSLILMIGSLLLFYRLARKLLDESSSASACLCCSVIPGFMELGIVARPYSLALFCTLASFLSLLRWKQFQQPVWYWIYVCFSILAIWSHYLFSVVFLIQFAFLLSWSEPRWSLIPQFFMTAIISFASLLPFFLQMKHLSDRRQLLSWTGVPNFADLYPYLLPPHLEISLLILLSVLGILRLVRPQFLVTDCFDRRKLATLLVWHIAPVIFFFFVAWFRIAELYTARYFFWQLPAGILIVFLFLSLIGDAIIRSILGVGIALSFSALVFSHPIEVHEDWRSAVALVRSLKVGNETAILARTGFVESGSPAWLYSSPAKDYLGCPISYYDSKLNFQLLPYRLEQDLKEPSVLQKTKELLDGASFALVILRTENGPPETRNGLTEIFHEQGFNETSEWKFNGVLVQKFQREF